MQMSQIKGTSLPQLFKLQNGHKKNRLTKFSFACCNKKAVPVKSLTQWVSLVIEKVNKRIKKV